jgi:hypothetical protein
VDYGGYTSDNRFTDHLSKEVKLTKLEAFLCKVSGHMVWEIRALGLKILLSRKPSKKN